MLKVIDVKKSFGGVEAIRGSTFSVSAGTAMALIGPNGAGKTTLFDIIGGFVRPNSGTVIFRGQDISALAPHDRANLGISRTFQQVRLFKYLSILDHLVMADSSDDTHVWKNIFSRFKPDQARYEDVLQHFGIKRPLATIVSDLSYGQRKLLQLAMALRRHHTLLMLDEPVAGVNKVIQEQIENLLLQFKGQGETILLIDHDMSFVRRLADQIICLDAGVVVAAGTPEEVLNNPKVLEAYLGV